VATGAWLALGSDDPVARWANGLAAAVAGALLAAGLALRQPVAVPAALLALGGGYATLLGLEGGALDERAPVVAAALFLVAELAYWSLELRDAVADEPGAYARRLALVAALGLGALAVGAGLLAVVDAGGGIGLEVVGAVAAVAALAIVALAARRTEP